LSRTIFPNQIFVPVIIGQSNLHYWLYIYLSGNAVEESALSIIPVVIDEYQTARTHYETPFYLPFIFLFSPSVDNLMPEVLIACYEPLVTIECHAK
jgi:hypothetical protein